MVYLGDNWPDEYRGSLFTCNLHGNRINRDLLEAQGSGYKAERGKDFMFANDPWFRGLAIKYGPDGGVFVSDWCDTGECHNYDKIDLTNGRIHKIVYGKVKPWKGDLSKLSDEELIEAADAQERLVSAARTANSARACESRRRKRESTAYCSRLATEHRP